MAEDAHQVPMLRIVAFDTHSAWDWHSIASRVGLGGVGGVVGLGYSLFSFQASTMVACHIKQASLV